MCDNQAVITHDGQVKPNLHPPVELKNRTRPPIYITRYGKTCDSAPVSSQSFITFFPQTPPI